MEVFHARDPEAFVAGSVETVPAADIVQTDYANGRVTFQVSHLSVFSVGAAAEPPEGESPACGKGTDSAGCFLSAVAEDGLGARLLRVVRRVVEWTF